MQKNKTATASGIANWPPDRRPREKLLLKGADTLTDAELLAIFLRVGVKGKSAVALAEDLLSRFGSLRGLYASPAEELRAVVGVGPAKIAQFMAVLEMSKRYLAEGLTDRAYVESSDDVLKLLYQEMRDLDREVFKVVLLNGQNHILKMVELGKGSLTTAAVYPREVVKIALRHAAAAIVLVHNHPSGIAKPSREDRKITRDLVLTCLLMGMRVHDHIIIGENHNFSFANAGLIDEYAAELNEGATG